MCKWKCGVLVLIPILLVASVLGHPTNSANNNTVSAIRNSTNSQEISTTESLPKPPVESLPEVKNKKTNKDLQLSVENLNNSSEIVVDSAEVYLNSLYKESDYVPGSRSRHGEKPSQTVQPHQKAPIYQPYIRNSINPESRKITKKPRLGPKKKIVPQKPVKKKAPVRTNFYEPSSISGTFAPTSFANKLPFDGKETEMEGESEEDDDDDEDSDDYQEDDYDFFYDELEDSATSLITGFTKRPPPPYKLEEDQYNDDYYADEMDNYSSEKDTEDMSFSSFFMDFFYDLYARFTGYGGPGDSADYEDDEYYDENNYAARRTTPRGFAYRKSKRGKRPSYSQILGFYGQEKPEKANENSVKADEDGPQSKWLSWFDSGADESSKAIETTTQPMTTEGSWGIFNMFNEEPATTTISTTISSEKPPVTASSPDLNGLLSVLSERLASTAPSPTVTDLPLAQPSTQKSYKNYQLWRLKPINDEHLQALNGIRAFQTDYQWWQGPTLEGKTDVLVPPNKVDELRELLSDEEIKYTTTMRNVEMAIKYSNPQIPHSESFQLEAIQGHPMTWHRYHRYADIVKYFEYLHRKYPKNVNLVHIGRTFEGRPIIVCHIFERPPKVPEGVKRRKQGIFLESGMRGHEWIGPAVATWILEDLSRSNFRLTNRTLDGVLLSREWYILPVANPDGYEYTHTTDRLWTKNRSRKKKTSVSFFSNFFSLSWFTKGNADQQDLKADEQCLGVDLGRNFDYRWNRDENVNSASCSDSYAGTKPFSESETRSLAKYLIKIAPTLKLYISLQSYGQFVSLPSAKQLPLERFEAIESAESAVNSLRRFGLPLVKYFVDEDSVLRDSVAGSSDGFVTRELEVKRAFTIKLRDTGENGFLLPPSYIETTAREAFEMIKILVDDLRRRD